MLRLENRQLIDNDSGQAVEIESLAADLSAAKDIGFEILNYARPIVSISLAEKDAFEIQTFAESDGFRAEILENSDLHRDHLVAGDYVFPLDRAIFRELEFVAGQLSLPIRGKVDYSGFRAITRLKSETQVHLEVDDAIEDELSNRLSANRDNQLKTDLWDYQKTGFSWMANLWDMGLGGVLADEMGVGKTMQLLALVAHVNTAKVMQVPILVVVPNNLLLNWARETARHAPELSAVTHLHWGPHRSKDFQFLEKMPVIYTTYSMVSQDVEFLSLIQFETIICDEAHWAKDPTSFRTQSLKKLRTRTSFLATGTPVQNRLLDLWSLMDIVDRGLLGSLESFEAVCSNSPSEARQLGQLVEHRILRRTQEQVGLEIPESFEVTVPLALSSEEMGTYRQIRGGTHPDFQGAKGRALIWPQRQFTAHTGFFSGSSAPESGQKAHYLLDEFGKINEKGEKAIAFVADCNDARALYRELISQFFPDSFAEVIDGQTTQELRFGILERFRIFDGSAILFLNPVVSGEGETIVEANHVFHMNPGWNPAKLDQSSFRVKRPGQKRTVVIHRLFYADTIEESLMDLIEEKRDVSEAALEAAQNRTDRAGFTKQIGIREHER
jgi:SNF2 family DNA or RNA helicase